ncbi:hypothetical protein QZH41_020489 [Actinostola sp. cb2023]|nr:hypothetical protein QZH41_020489 [Actinostola sp. cb2023]
MTNLVEKLKDVTSLVDNVEDTQEVPVVALPQDVFVDEEETKNEEKEQSTRKNSSQEKRISPTSKENSQSRPSKENSQSRPSKENSQSKSSKSIHVRSERSKGSTISGRHSSSELKHANRKRKLSESDDEEIAVSTQLFSSVVKVQEKRERPRSPKFIVTLDGVDSELEDKFEKHSKHKEIKHKKSKSEFDDYVEIDTTSMAIAQPETTPEKVEFVAPAVEQVMFRLDNTSDDEEMHQMSVVSRPQERCKFWPDCMNGPTCPFYHPLTSCRMFPNCKFADKCLFIHPLCKFDGRCTNTSCPFLHKNKSKPPHVAPVKSSSIPVPQVDESLPNLAQLTPCKFFPGCTRNNCPFLHPKPTKPTATKVCRYGSVCSRIDCMFSHPPSKSALKWVAPSLHIRQEQLYIIVE